MHRWNNDAPIYRQLADRLTDRLLSGEPADGQAMPSVRALAGEYLLNPLTVSRALQVLVDDALLESRRGLGMYVQVGARDRLHRAVRARFLSDEWPVIVARLRQLGIEPTELNWNPPGA